MMNIFCVMIYYWSYKNTVRSKRKYSRSKSKIKNTFQSTSQLKFPRTQKYWYWLLKQNTVDR